ncbi:MAG: T9SS type A sorting domain-containing protein [Bacteroidetes bacterium]|nr:T9SS type A sorting domain-containing protein [Bacteroidota bacterium]
MKKIILLLVLLISLPSFAQMTPQWQNYYGVKDSLGIFPMGMVVDDSSNTYVMEEAARLTYTESPPRDPFIQKINKYGETIWIKNFGLDISRKEFPLSIKYSSDKFLYFLCSQFDSSLWTMNLFKLNTEGNQIWKKRIGYYDYQYFQEVNLTSTGTIYSNGASYTNGKCLYKFNPAGEIIDSIFIVINNMNAGIERYNLTADNKVFIFSELSINDIKNSFISFADTTHNIFWTKELNYRGNPYALQSSKDSSLYVCFYREETLNGVVLSIYKYDYAGNLKWLKELPGPVAINNDVLYYGYYPHILIDNDNNPVISSTMKDAQFSSTNTLAIIKLDKSTGNELWINRVDNLIPGSNGILRNSVIDSLGNIYACGEIITGNIYDFVILKISSSGQVLRITRNNGFLNFRYFPYHLALAKNNDLIVTGIDFNPPFWEKGATIRYSQPVNITPSGNNLPDKFSLNQNYPNPFNPSTTIIFQIPKNNFVSLKVFDINGKEVSQLVNENLNAGEYKINFNGAALPSGVYYYKLTGENFSETKKMILIK